MTMSWDAEMKERAARARLFLYKFVFQGKHAGTGLVEGAGAMAADRAIASIALLSAERGRIEHVIAELNRITAARDVEFSEDGRVATDDEVKEEVDDWADREYAKLATLLMDRFPGDQQRDETAMDWAMRLLAEYADRRER